jgi:hypothetical protein
VLNAGGLYTYNIRNRGGGGYLFSVYFLAGDSKFSKNYNVTYSHNEELPIKCTIDIIMFDGRHSSAFLAFVIL